MNRSSPAYVLFFMLAVSTVFGIGLAAVNHSTRDILAQNEALHENRTLSNAFMLDVRGDSPEAFQEAVSRSLSMEEITHEGRTIQVFTTKAERPKRIGFLFSGLGFWGPIRGIAVFSEDLKTMVGLQFLEHQETPGLGARIEEPWFTDQFKGLKIAWEQAPGKRIIIGTETDSAAGNRVDAITGASQTSMALMASLNAELDLFRKAYANRIVK